MKSKKNTIFFFTKYTYVGASSRYRVYQYLPYFEANGFNFKVKPFFSDGYLFSKYQGKRLSKLYFLKRYIRRIKDVLAVNADDLIYVEYELLPFFFPFLEKWLKYKKIKYIVDYDDAIFHKYDDNPNHLIRGLFKNKIPTVIKNAQKIITGSQYLTEFAEKYNDNILEIPTSIDFVKYFESSAHTKSSDFFIIGWIGTPSSSRNVLNILPALKQFLAKYPAKLILIGFDSGLRHLLQSENIELVTWNEEKEVSLIKSFDVGIMPLDNTPFNLGKCGFKLIQYMACGLPTISTPLVANLNIDKKKENLFATTNDNWFEALEKIYFDYDYFGSVVGKNNVDIVKKYYSIQSNHIKFVDAFNELSNTSN